MYEFSRGKKALHILEIHGGQSAWSFKDGRLAAARDETGELSQIGLFTGAGTLF
jgi:hypothetical protein